jgi:hypothetical protein
MIKYFKICDDVNLPSRWWLGMVRDGFGIEVDPDSFTIAHKVDVVTPLAISLQHDGDPLDFTLAAFELPIVSSRTLNLLYELAPDAFQAFFASIENHEGSYAIINFLEIRKCLDETKSEFIKWTKSDHRADKAGQYRQVTKLKIDAKLVADTEIFRLWGWDTQLIVSERIQRAFIQRKISGVYFVEA